MDKALSEGLLDLANFDVRHYRYYEIPQYVHHVQLSFDDG